ncbi:unnamed protein product [Paramecium sonneborni]|uniref:Uncharacterized protein n=1 Tax=Paramecium sonneborni TaxID=65129 RepID=A0A8S1P621_9CILI|nr:unnamed protein product [Paramecium sonneborni]
MMSKDISYESKIKMIYALQKIGEKQSLLMRQIKKNRQDKQNERKNLKLKIKSFFRFFKFYLEKQCGSQIKTQ